MLLKANHQKSMSCLHLQKIVKRKHPQPQCRKSTPSFVPFYSERHIGKLILSEENKSEKTNQELMEQINFRNFNKIYSIISKRQNQRYSQLTRKSQQKNLINEEWRVNSLRKISDHHDNKHKAKLQSIKKIELPMNNLKSKKQLFEKSDNLLFKKLSNIKQPPNPEYESMYKNYIQISELNENERRKQLLNKNI